MTKELVREKVQDKLPIYSQIWNNLKKFPKGLAEGSRKQPEVSGPAAAALISAGFGSFLMMTIHHLSDTAKAVEDWLWKIGSWIPGSHNQDKIYGNIGSYSGKETMLLIGWLVSWLILHQLWRHKNIKARTMFFWMFVFFVAATAMTWHPLFPYLPLMPKS